MLEIYCYEMFISVGKSISVDVKIVETETFSTCEFSKIEDDRGGGSKISKIK
jgi:hypothetical protein